MLHNSPLLSEGFINYNTIIMADPETVGIGIHESNPTPANQSWIIRNNYISILNEKSKGISINSADHVRVFQNDISINYSQAYDYTGIYLGGSTNTSISCNDVVDEFQLSQPNSSSEYMGKAIQVIQSPSSLLDCNAITGTPTGINFWGMCDDSETRGNTMRENSVGLLYGLYPDEGNAFTGLQNHLGNSWSGTFGEVGARHLGDAEISNSSKYIVDYNESLSFLPSWDADGQWFEDIPDQYESYSCKKNETCSSSKRVLRFNNLDEKISLGKLSTEGFDKSLNWTGQQHLYRRMANDPAIRESYKEFYDKQGGNAVAQLMETFRELEDLYDVEEFNNQEWAKKQEALRISFEEIIEHRTAFFSTTENSSRAELLEKENRELITFNDLQTTTPGKEQQVLIEKERNTQLVTIAKESDEIYLQNWVDVHQVLASRINDYTVDFSEQDIKRLTIVANQCVLSGGDGERRKSANRTSSKYFGLS